MTSRQLDEEAIFQSHGNSLTQNLRSTYLDQVCAGDAPLRERVKALLEVHDRDQEFLKSSGDPAPTAEPPVDPRGTWPADRSLQTAAADW